MITSQFNVFGNPGLSDEQRKLKVGFSRRYMLENKGFVGAGAYGESHPVLDGTLGSVLEDLKFRVAIIVSIGN